MSTAAEVWERAYSKVNMILWYFCNTTPIIFLSSHWHLIQKQNFRQQDQILSRDTGRKAPYICIRGQFLHEISSITPYSTTRFTGSINEETSAWALSLFTKRTHGLQMTSLMLPQSMMSSPLETCSTSSTSPHPHPHPSFFAGSLLRTCSEWLLLHPLPSCLPPLLFFGWRREREGTFPSSNPLVFAQSELPNPRIWNLTFRTWPSAPFG